MKKKFLCLILALMLILISNTNVFAATQTTETQNCTINKQISVQKIEPNKAGDTSFVTKEVDRDTKKHMFVGYLKEFPEWTKSKEYHLESGRTYTVSAPIVFKEIPVTVEFSQSFSGGRVIEVPKPNKYSRLAASVDVTLIKYEKTKLVGGVPVSKSYYVIPKVHDKYIDVVYK